MAPITYSPNPKRSNPSPKSTASAEYLNSEAQQVVGRKLLPNIAKHKTIKF